MAASGQQPPSCCAVLCCCGAVVLWCCGAVLCCGAVVLWCAVAVSKSPCTVMMAVAHDQGHQPGPANGPQQAGPGPLQRSHVPQQHTDTIQRRIGIYWYNIST